MGQRMWANIALINYGKSPALRMEIAGTIFVGPSAKTSADTWFAMLGEGPVKGTGSNPQLVVPQGIPSLHQPPAHLRQTSSRDSQ